MPCKDALVKKVKTVKPDDTVESALKILRKAKSEVAPVVDEAGAFKGVFSIAVLLSDTLPVSVSVENKTLGNVRIPAAPGMGKRLQKKKAVTVDKIMTAKAETVGPDDSVETAANLLRASGGPVVVVDADGMFQGVVTPESLLEYLEKTAA